MQVGTNSRVKIATRAAIDHEGHVLGGRSICEGGIKEDNYIAELAAQLDALTDAVTRGSEERIVIVFDATSPVRAMLECVPSWWHFHFECSGESLITARKAYALKAVEARRRMVV